MTAEASRRPPWSVRPDERDGFVVLEPTVPAVPVVVHVPHASMAIPDDVRAAIVLDDRALTDELIRITDHRTDVLAEDTASIGATRVVNARSRLVVDPERFTEPELEVMERRGMGAVYTATTSGERLRTHDPAGRAALLDRFFAPYAMAFSEVVARHLDLHDRCTIVDLHSYPSERLPYEIGGDERPEVCIGTDPFHTPSWLRETVADVAARHGLRTAQDTPFSGVYVPLDRYQRDDRVSAVMLELRRDLYLDASTAEPHAGEALVRSFVTDVVRGVATR